MAVAVVPGAAAPMPMPMAVDTPPNQTIYVHNLFEKLPKDELKRCMYAMFSQFGKVIDVVALKTFRLRGQAWVVFDDVASAVAARRAMDGFPFFGKPIRIEFARTKSDAVAKLDGSYVPDKDKRRAQVNAEKREGLIVRGQQRRAAAAAAGGPIPMGAAAVPLAGAAGPGAAAAQQAPAPPNPILFVQGLPDATTAAMLAMLFKQFPGYKEARTVEARPGIAFVEFESAAQAGVALAGLQGFKVTPTHAMALSYART